MRVRIERVKMVGGGYSYNILVPSESVPKWVREDHPNGCHYTVIDIKGKYYYDLYHATMSQSHSAMHPGIDRWETHCAHEKETYALSLRLLKEAFPETKNLSVFPVLWLEESELGRIEGKSVRWVEI